MKSRHHTPVVFDDPERFQRRALAQEHGLIEQVAAGARPNAALDYLNKVSVSAAEASALVREAWAKYKTPVDYGIAPLQLPKVAACINAGLPASIGPMLMEAALAAGEPMVPVPAAYGGAPFASQRKSASSVMNYLFPPTMVSRVPPISAAATNATRVQ